MSELDLSGMDTYGVRALMYVREHCPARFASIEDPVSFFSTLGLQLREQVEAVEEALMGPAPALEDAWADTAGRWNMARLSAEEQVFSEMVYQPMPAENDDPVDESGAYVGGLPDLSDLMTPDEIEDES